MAPDDAQLRRPSYGWAWLAVVVAAAVLSWPWVRPHVERAIYVARLASQPTPETLPVPVRGVTAGALRDTWHAARGIDRRHEGIDIFAPRGTPVLSTTEGIVSRSGTNKLGGNVVWVLGPGRQMHYYAHLDDYAGLSPGDRVLPGTVLGYVGNTGNAQGTPPHLHYGIYAGTGAVNPYPLLRAPASVAPRPVPGSSAAADAATSSTSPASRAPPARLPRP